MFAPFEFRHLNVGSLRNPSNLHQKSYREREGRCVLERYSTKPVLIYGVSHAVVAYPQCIVGASTRTLPRKCKEFA